MPYGSGKWTGGIEYIKTNSEGSDMKRLGIWCILGLFVLSLAMPANAAAGQVEAKSAVLMDIATGTVLHEQAAHERFAPASVTNAVNYGGH